MSKLFVSIVVAFVIATPSLACQYELKFSCHQGSYLIVNPDPDLYTGIHAEFANGTQCEAANEGLYGFTVLDCGPTPTVKFMTENGEATSCTISCSNGDRSQVGYSVGMDFVLQSQSILRSGSAHFYCHSSGTVFIRNPRDELYTHSIAYATADDAQCVATHILDNQVIEITGCNLDERVILISSGGNAITFEITRKTDIFALKCNPSPVISNGANNGLSYNCYKDGTILATNPRSELFCHSYAEQAGKKCNSVYVKTFSQIIISGCDTSQPIFLLLSRIPIDDSALIIRPNNVFLIRC